MTVAGLLLAAGGGRRFGGPKALAVVDGERFVERGIRLLAGAGCTPVAVVLGADADRIRGEADLRGAEVVVNPGWATGMGSSLRCGLAALEGRCHAVVVALADQPLVGVTCVERLVAAWRSGAVAAVATYAGVPRNPVLLDRSTWAEAAAAAVGDAGARAFLRSAAAPVTEVACDGTGRPDDVDTPADLAGLETRDQEQPCS
jgi:CTP:molybdopterin cytidylyltransferase MocA